jgi:DNA polymerase-3 subunit alpha (Gram-positive type)
MRSLTDLLSAYPFIEVESIEISKEDGVIRLILLAQAYLQKSVEVSIKDAIAEAFPYGFKLNLLIKYQGITDIAFIIEDLRSHYVDDAPFIKSIIEGEYEYANHTLQFEIAGDALLRLVKSKKTDMAIEAYILHRFGLAVRVLFKIVEFIDDCFEQEKEEELKKLSETIQRTPSSESKPQLQATKPERRYQKAETGPNVVYKKEVKGPFQAMDQSVEDETLVAYQGELVDVNRRELKGGKHLLSFALSDYTNTLLFKMFLTEKEADPIMDTLKVGDHYRVEGRSRYDTFERDSVVHVLGISKVRVERKIKVDQAEVKRVELHMHTTMSAMDALTPVKKLIKRAAEWGHKAIAITDHGVVQAFPDAMEEGKKCGIKIIYGVEGYLLDDKTDLVIGLKEDVPFEGSFVVFDIETTGLSAQSDKIIEIGAVKIKDKLVIDTFTTFVQPGVNLSEFIINLTGITDAMLIGAPTINQVLPNFMSFIEGSVLVAHNAPFDTSFIRVAANKQKISFSPCIMDTLSMSRLLLPELKKHKLNLVAKHLDVPLEAHHRALDDAQATGGILLKLFKILEQKDIHFLRDLNRFATQTMDFKNYETHHIILLAQNKIGLRNLYELISHSHIETFYKKPRIPKSLLSKKREGLIVGSACEAGEIFQALLQGKSHDELVEVASFYDYLEIQPAGNNQFLLDQNRLTSLEALLDMNRAIVNLGEELNKPVVATCDVHFMDEHEEVYRRILMKGQGFSDADNQPPLYLRTTEEMLGEFTYLGSEKAYEVVVTNTNLIAESIDDMIPIPDGTFPPFIAGSAEDLNDMCYAKARRMYGENLPEEVETRLDRELTSIIKHGYAVMYMIASKLVTKSLRDGYLVGSRGSVGSSLAATMSDITEVNPLPPHYRCPNCFHSEFILDGSIGSGADLPDKICPSCDTQLIKDGHDIPFEVFLGFEADKEPDIDLNFAGEYQAVAHQYTEELFGKGYVFRAGTIGTIADKTAFGFVKKYFEETGKKVSNREVARLAVGCTGVKRTSGQHPGGIMVVPGDMDIHEFTPIQYPANDSSSGIITTHFDYHSISGRILKLDILGHDVPTIIKMLEEMTGLNGMEIPLDDALTKKIFTSIAPLKITDPTYPIAIGSLGIPEFGTKFVRQMLDDTQPTTFAELVRISGLSHGTDVWINNAQDLVRAKTAELKDVISTRDDIMIYLIHADLPKKMAFTIMENVRKGKGLKPEHEEMMREKNVPEWYIASCNKIQYMFPKAHAVAYVMMSVRIAYCKVHYPLAFYATFFSTKVTDFDADLVCKGPAAVKKAIADMEARNDLTAKEVNAFTILEVVREMYARDLSFHTVDLYRSEATRFAIHEGKLLPPLCALQGVGENAARSIVEVRKNGEFLSKDDLRVKSKSTKVVIEALTLHGALGDLPDDNQLTFQFA